MKKILINLFILAFLSLGSLYAQSHAERRNDNAFQVQAVSGNTVLGVAQPGLSVGYHFSDTIYFGVQGNSAQKEEKEKEEKFNEDDTKYNQRYKDKTTVQEGKKYSAEIRLTPWDIGFYFSVGYIQIEESKIDTTFKKKLRIVGNSAYTTGLKAKVKNKAWSGSAAGLGYNHIFTNGISLGAGFLVGLTDQSKPDVTVESFGGDSVSDSDLKLWKKEIEKIEKSSPHLVTIAVGYNF